MVDNNPALTVACEVGAGPAGVADAIARAKAFAAEAPCGPEAEARLLILVEEIVSNIIEHGRPPKGSSITIEMAAIGADIGLTISDGGTYFDPRAHVLSEPVVPSRGGGAGIALIRAWSTVIDYARVRDRNTLRLVIANHG